MLVQPYRTPHDCPQGAAPRWPLVVTDVPELNILRVPRNSFIRELMWARLVTSATDP